MDESGRDNALEEFEKALRDSAQSQYVLRLYITGSTPNSIRALENARAICERYLPSRYQLEVIDLYQQPARARQDQVVAAPTLVRKEPGPPRRVVGDLSDTLKVLRSLEITVAP